MATIREVEEASPRQSAMSSMPSDYHSLAYFAGIVLFTKGT